MITFNICKHIHACVQKLRNDCNNEADSSKSRLQKDDPESDDVPKFVLSDSQLYNINDDEARRRDEEIFSKLEVLKGLCTTSTFSQDERQEIIKGLDKLLGAVSKSRRFVKKMEINKERRDRRQNRTFPLKKKRRTEAENYNNCSRLEEQLILDSFNQKNNKFVNVSVIHSLITFICKFQGFQVFPSDSFIFVFCLYFS